MSNSGLPVPSEPLAGGTLAGKRWYDWFKRVDRALGDISVGSGSGSTGGGKGTTGGGSSGAAQSGNSIKVPTKIRAGIMAPQFGISEYEMRPIGHNEWEIPETDGYMEGATITFTASAPAGVTLDVTFNVTQCDFFVNGEWVDAIPHAIDYRWQPSHADLPLHSVESGGLPRGVLLFDYYDGPSADRKATKFRFKGTMDIAVSVPTPAATEESTAAESTPVISSGDGLTVIQNQESGFTQVMLEPVGDTGGGVLQKTDVDQFGRVVGKSSATTDDLPEGSNLYFTEDRTYVASKSILKQGAGVTITPNDGGKTLTISAASSVDGGSASSVYLPSQSINGGGA